MFRGNGEALLGKEVYGSGRKPCMTDDRSEKVGTPVSSCARGIRSTSHRMSTFLRFGLCCARLLESLLYTEDNTAPFWVYKEAEEGPNSSFQQRSSFFEASSYQECCGQGVLSSKGTRKLIWGCTCFSNRLPCQISQG